MAKDDHAVVIGVSGYPYLESLQGPAADADDFEAWLLNEGQVDKKNVHKFTSRAYPPPPPADPTERRVATEAFKVLADLFNNNGPIGRRLYLYMAGHGVTFTRDSGSRNVGVLMANATKDQPKHNIPGLSYVDWFGRARAFDELVLFMDCCRAETVNAPPYCFPFRDRVGNTKTEVKTFYGFAAKADKTAFEQPFPSPHGPVRGVFTMGLLSGLRGGAKKNKRGRITGTSLKNYVWKYVDQLLRNNERHEADFLTSHDSSKTPDIEFP